MRPGSTALIVTPSPADSRARCFSAASRPARLAFDSCRPGIGSRAELDDTATTRPKPRSRICGSRRSRIFIGEITSER